VLTLRMAAESWMFGDTSGGLTTATQPLGWQGDVLITRGPKRCPGAYARVHARWSTSPVRRSPRARSRCCGGTAVARKPPAGEVERGRLVSWLRRRLDQPSSVAAESNGDRPSGADNYSAIVIACGQFSAIVIACGQPEGTNSSRWQRLLRALEFPNPRFDVA